MLDWSTASGLIGKTESCYDIDEMVRLTWYVVLATITLRNHTISCSRKTLLICPKRMAVRYIPSSLPIHPPRHYKLSLNGLWWPG